jgi:photosystem II stability/assembly factor-like uncharacterized protein
MKNTLLACLVLAATNIFAQEFTENWDLLSVPPTPRVDDIFFIDGEIGWAAGGGSGNILKTTDGGTTWTTANTSPFYLRSIEFLNDQIGFCGSFSNSGPPAFYRTADGGNTWLDISSSIDAQIPGICGLAKADENTIYGVGAWFEPAYVVKSTDQGETWTFIDMSAYATSLIDAYFFDANHGFVTGGRGELGGVVLYTEDGGLTWEEKFQTGHIDDVIWKIQSPDGKHFFGSIQSWVDDTRMIRSNDGGQSWEMNQVHPDYYFIQTVGFIDSLRGWTGGKLALFETEDGGGSWKRLVLGQGFTAFNRFAKVNDSTAFLTGSSIYRFSRQTIKPEPPVTGTEHFGPEEIHKLSVTPNPNKGIAKITIDFGAATYAQLSVYGTTGKHLKRLLNEQVHAGRKEIMLDLSNEPDQMYIVILKTHEGMETTKFVKGTHSGTP